MVDPESFKNVKRKWIKELQANSQSAPIVLVGTKKDLTKNESYLQENGVRPVPTEEGNQAKIESNLYAFVEASALT